MGGDQWRSIALVGDLFAFVRESKVKGGRYLHCREERNNEDAEEIIECLPLLLPSFGRLMI